MMNRFVKVAVAAVFCAAAAASFADEIHVAVAANFTAPAKELAPVFEAKTGHKVILSFGSTGMFYGQIKNGATYDVLLAALRTRAKSRTVRSFWKRLTSISVPWPTQSSLRTASLLMRL